MWVLLSLNVKCTPFVEYTPEKVNPKKGNTDMTQSKARKRFLGSSIMEYALPIACILIAGGVLTTTMNINGIMGDYFKQASGNKGAALTNGTFKAPSVASGATGSVGTGGDAFNNIGRIVDGVGGQIRLGDRNYNYTGPTSRNGTPQTMGGNGDQLYAIGDKGPMYQLAAQLAKDGAPQEYVSRILQMAMTTDQLAQSKGDNSSVNMDAKTAALRAQLASNLSYVGAHQDEISKNGGAGGVQIWAGAASESIKNTDDLHNALKDDTMSKAMMTRIETLYKEGASNDKIKAELERMSITADPLPTVDEALRAVGADLALKAANGASVDPRSLMSPEGPDAYVSDNFSKFTGNPAEDEWIKYYRDHPPAP